jgi:hypothetical protein
MSSLERADFSGLCGVVGMGCSQYQLHKTRAFQNIRDVYGAKKEEAASCLRATISREMNLTGHVECIGIKKILTEC